MNLLHLLLAVAGRPGAWSRAAVVRPTLGVPSGNGGLAGAVFSRDGSKVAFQFSDGSGSATERVFVAALNGPSAVLEADLNDGSADGGFGTGGIALSADGNTLVVADASYASDGMNARGRVSVYRRQETGTWALSQIIEGPQAFTYLGGGGVALSSDSSLLAACSLYSTGGSHQAIRIYSRSPDAYSQVLSIPAKGKLASDEDLRFFSVRGLEYDCEIYRRGTGLTWSLVQQLAGEYGVGFAPDGDWLVTITASAPYAYRFYRWNGSAFVFSSTIPSTLTGGVSNGFQSYVTLTRYAELFHAYESTAPSGKVYRRSGDSWSVEVEAVPTLIDTAPNGRSRLSPWGNYLVWPNGPFVYAYR